MKNGFLYPGYLPSCSRKIALRTKLPEKEIAIMAIKLAEIAHEENREDYRKSHVGYYLIGKAF